MFSFKKVTGGTGFGSSQSYDEVTHGLVRSASVSMDAAAIDFLRLL